MPSMSSLDLSAYRFAQPTVSGLTPVHSFENNTQQTAPLSHSYGTGPSISFSHQHEPTMSTHRSKNKQGKSPVRSPQVLTWRIDPDESLSDWTLTVVSISGLDQNRDDNEEKNEDRNHESTGRRMHSLKTQQEANPTKKYFVHRTQLAVGPRRSEYFVQLFKNKIKKGSKTNGTRIELRPSAANAFPLMLDFIYSPIGTPPNVTTESAVALRHLATCFGIRELFDSVTEFIKGDLCAETSTTYMMEAESFRHEKLFGLSLNICAENFETIKFSRIVTLTAELFEKVVLSDNLDCASEVLSSRVASYCRCRPGAVDVDMLKKITCQKKMPQIAPEESLFFLHLLSEIDGEDESVAGGGTQDLYQRCLAASAEIVRMAVKAKQTTTPSSKKSSLDSRPKRNAMQEYHALPATVKVDLLEHALSESPTIDDLKELDIARKESKKKLSNDNAKKLKDREEEMERVRRAYEKKLALLQATVEAQEEEIQTYATELSKFSRVPNDYRVKPQLSEHTFQAKPKYDESGKLLYGDVPPSALPIFGRQTQDGWVYREDHWLKDGCHVHALWPMYFYKGDAY